MNIKSLIVVLLPLLLVAAEWQSLNGPPSGRADDMSIGWHQTSQSWHIYAAGVSIGISTAWDFTVISLPPDYGVMEENNVVRNSCYGTTIFRGSIILPEGKTCRVFDVTGRVVLPDKIKPGIYFIEVDGKITRKVIKVR